MSQKVGKNNNKVYRLVLTGGPCGGKTTGQARLCTFFENLGWKVYRVPETARVLLGGGVKWADLTEAEAYFFQENLIKTMMQIEETFFDLASGCPQNCLVVSDRGIMDASALFFFQENLIKTMMQIEETYFDLAAADARNTLVVCDRGIMDATAYMKPGQWDEMKVRNSWNDVEMRDNRYNQVIHMVSAAKGAEAFYQTDTHIRHENLDLARQLDDFASQSWVGHPYYDIIDNTTDFEAKVVRMIAAVCNRLGIDAGDRLSIDSKKRKFLVAILPEELDLTATISVAHHQLTDENGCPMNNSYPQFQDFIVVHDYLVTPNSKMQARIRRRGQNVKWDRDTQRWNLETDNRYSVTVVSLNEDDLHSSKVFVYGTDQDFSNWTYTHTIRRPKINNESPELKMQISSREYELLLAQRDSSRYTVYKKRRCFLWNNQYFQMDIYQEPCHPRCSGLIILETYTTHKGTDLQLPEFLQIVKEVTEDPTYSMYNLTRMEPGTTQDKTLLDLTLPSSQSLKDKAILVRRDQAILDGQEKSQDKALCDSNILKEEQRGESSGHCVNGAGHHSIPNGKA